jgi:predicted alpha/beta hydrolase family esterase
MIPRVLLVHGWGGSGTDANWMHWMEKELQKKGIGTIFPELPNADFPQEKEWLKMVFDSFPSFDSSSILVGHSLGVPTILRVLERLPENQAVRAAFLVAGFCRDLGISEIAGFVNHSFDWKKIRSNCPTFVQIYSDNDPFISAEESLFLASQLGIQPLLEKDCGHINEPQFGPYPRLLELVLKEGKKK